ncbi:MAG: 1-acyl-sn-glycerol-3-phosphate acyltransferase [Nocardioides sp.]|uniref:1-acyl-sn-glycerol-3-phosphate acyltransferase n=1 Tax=Nocardioides sp. TaxID=35761 RepID=UPI0039E7230B
MASLLRRVVLAPLIIVLTALAWVTAPLWLLIAAAVSPRLPGHWRPLRVLWMVMVYATGESLLLVVMFGLWISSGFGRLVKTPYFQGIHYDLLQGMLWVLFREGQRVLNTAIVISGPAPEARPSKPLIVCSRHAGPGDSFILVGSLMNTFQREPRIVLKYTLAWDPMFDIVLHRLPARFIRPNPRPGEDVESQIRELAAGLDENDAFVIFPEGGNFTPKRRERGIARLRKLGLEKMADRAEAMTHLLAPRPGGVLAALDAAPDADVAMVAHTGLDHLNAIGDIWRELPMDKQITMRWWRVQREEIPADREARIDWLYGWWEQIDAWIEENRPEEAKKSG